MAYVAIAVSGVAIVAGGAAAVLARPIEPGRGPADMTAAAEATITDSAENRRCTRSDHRDGLVRALSPRYGVARQAGSSS